MQFSDHRPYSVEDLQQFVSALSSPFSTSSFDLLANHCDNGTEFTGISLVSSHSLPELGQSWQQPFQRFPGLNLNILSIAKADDDPHLSHQTPTNWNLNCASSCPPNSCGSANCDPTTVQHIPAHHIQPLKNNINTNNCGSVTNNTATKATRVPIALGKGKFLLVKAHHRPTISQLSIPPRSPSRRLIIDRTNNDRPCSECVGTNSLANSLYRHSTVLTNRSAQSGELESLDSSTGTSSIQTSSIQGSPLHLLCTPNSYTMPEQSVEDIVQSFIEKDLSILDAFGVVSENSRNVPSLTPSPFDENAPDTSPTGFISHTQYSSDSPDSSKISQLAPSSLDTSDRIEKTTEKFSSENLSLISPVNKTAGDDHFTAKKVRAYPSSINAGSPKSMRKSSGVVDRFRNFGRRITSGGSPPMRSSSSRALLDAPDRGLNRTPTITMRFGSER